MFTPFGITALAGVGIGVFLTIIGVGPLAQNVAVSVCVGLVSVGISEALGRLLEARGKRRILIHLAGIPFGALAGVALLAFWIAPDVQGLQRIFLTVTSISLVLGGAVAMGFYLHGRQIELARALHEAELRKLGAERRGLEAQLKMLQAQIEPHFLFNTLANVTALIGSDPVLARQLLERLIVYLRATLARTRATGATLADEVDMLRAYLDICRIRMGDRLRYTLDLPADLLARQFPPMLLQPLVENAVKHGLEPRVASGELRVCAHNSEDRLRISVCDNGVGFADTGGNGAGLANVRERLAALYGGDARLELEENRDGGVTARLDLPA